MVQISRFGESYGLAYFDAFMNGDGTSSSYPFVRNGISVAFKDFDYSDNKALVSFNVKDAIAGKTFQNITVDISPDAATKSMRISRVWFS